MISMLKEVGRGKRGARDLPYPEASRAAEWILDGTATPAQIGAFLVAERIKMESIDEIQAFIDVLRTRFPRYPLPGSLDCAGPYDGRNRTFMATLPTAFILSACGLPVALHGCRSLPPKWGMTLPDVLEALGIDVDALSEEDVQEAHRQGGVLFVPTERWLPELERLRAIREEIGLRTVFNTAEKWLRYTDASYMAVGIFHATVSDKSAELLTRQGVKRGIIIQGLEGSEDLGVEKPTRTILVRDGSQDLYIVDPQVLNLRGSFPETEWTPQRQAAVTLAVLQGNADDAYRNTVILNAAVRLWVAEKVESIEEGIYSATHTLQQGMAWKQFNRWRETLSRKASIPSNPAP